jgi:predicted nucleic acid-binding protein
VKELISCWNVSNTGDDCGLIGRSLKDQELVDLMKEYGLDYEDDLHLAVALRNKAKEIISNDQDFDRTPLKRRFS